MNSKIDFNIQPPNDEATNEQRTAVADLVEHIMDVQKVEPIKYIEGMPASDIPALIYRLPIEDEQSRSLFLVPEVIRSKNPCNFHITYITPHRFDADPPSKDFSAVISIGYEYGDGQTASYNLWGNIPDQHLSPIEWSGEYKQEETSDLKVTSDRRFLTKADIRILVTILSSQERPLNH